MCFTEKGCCQCIARLRKRAKPWRQGCPVGEWCRIRKLLRKQAKPTRQGRPVGAAMCRRGSQIPCASPQQSKVKMAPTRKCRTWSWDGRVQPELTSRSNEDVHEKGCYGQPSSARQNATRECARNTRSARAQGVHGYSYQPNDRCALRSHEDVHEKGCYGQPSSAHQNCHPRVCKNMPPESVQEIRS